MKQTKSKKPDYYLLVLVIALVVLGILVLASVSAIFSQEKFGKTSYYLLHQIIYGLVPGIIVGIVALKISLSWIKKWAWAFVFINLIFMALVFVPKIGVVSGGAFRWINLGLFTFQPSEFLKLTFIIYLSALVASRSEKAPSKKKRKDWKITLIPFLLVLAIVTLLLTFQSDISTLAVIVFVAALIYFFGNTPLWHNFLIFSIIVGGILALIRLAPYRMERLLVFLGLKTDPMGIGYQIKQALIAVGSGGIAGLGLGMSSQKFGFIPQSMSDSIFAIFAEETGFIGSLVLIFLFLFFLWRGFRIAKNSQNRFSQLLALGITSWICIQGFVNIGAMIGVLPLTGIPLPFISYGGSHIAIELIGVGILLNISKSSKK